MIFDNPYNLIYKIFDNSYNKRYEIFDNSYNQRYEKSYNRKQKYIQIFKQQYKNSYDNFDISCKKPLKTLKYHTNLVSDSTILYDGRFVTCSFDG